MIPSRPECGASPDRPSVHIDLDAAPSTPSPAPQLEPTVDDLHKALRLGQLEVHYQPVVDLRRREVVGAEALVRWRHPDRGLLQPEQFARLADSTALIAELEPWLLETACRDGARWQGQGLPLEISVNLSMSRVTAPDFIDVVRRTLDTSGLDPRHLLVELTESAAMEDIDGAAATLTELNALGVSLAIGDFGTGYSSLVQLKRYPIAALKVDRSFVAGLGRHPDDDAIVSSIVKLAGAVGSLCIAGGVETRAQHTQLVDLGCERAQGPLFSPAVPAPQLPAAIDTAEAAVAVKMTEAARREPPKQVHPVPRGIVEHMLSMYESGSSFQTIAAALNQMGSLHPRGIRWHHTSVARCIADALSAADAPSDRRQRS